MPRSAVALALRPAVVSASNYRSQDGRRLLGAELVPGAGVRPVKIRPPSRSERDIRVGRLLVYTWCPRCNTVLLLDVEALQRRSDAEYARVGWCGACGFCLLCKETHTPSPHGKPRPTTEWLPESSELSRPAFSLSRDRWSP